MKFTCQDCAQNAWAKPDAELICGACYGEDETVVVMLAKELTGSRAEAA